MSNFKSILRSVLLVSVGMNLAMFAFGISVGSSDVYLLALASAVLCLIGHTSLTDDEDERK